MREAFLGFIIVFIELCFLMILSDFSCSYEEVGGEIGQDTTWGPNTTYYVSSNIAVDRVTLIIQEGTVIKFASGLSIQLMFDQSGLDVNGTATSSVVFTSMNDDSHVETITGSSGNPSPGDWDGLSVYQGTGQFDYCLILYGGDGTSGANVSFDHASADSYFRNSRTEYSTNYGIRIDDCSPEFRGSAFANNDGYGVYIDGPTANPDFGYGEGLANNAFESNGEYHLYNNTNRTINTIGGWYGSTMFWLSAFTGKAEHDKVTLIWRSEYEVDNVGFAIYRNETAGEGYTKIAFVISAKDSDKPNDYEFIDEQVQPGHTYYYLEDIDLSGQHKKSYIIHLTPVEETPCSCEPELPSTKLPAQKKREAPPRQDSVFANYPNPCNAETWIPYSLAEPANIAIQIYDVRGHLIRELRLGYRLAGFYLSRVKAAYWDGKDSISQQVGSGIYFYRLSAGSFSAVRKMVVLE